MEIVVSNLSKKIRGVKVLDNINLKLVGGKIYGLRGHNGCGKTMLMRAISGLIVPTSGSVAVDDEVLGRDISFPPSIGLMLEYPAFINGYSGFDNLKMVASIQRKISDERIREVLSEVGLQPDDKRVFKKYSLGMKQRLGIACAIMESPDLIILDEPVNALDEKGIKMVRNIIQKEKERGALVILACHDKDEMDYLADEIYVMTEGRIIMERDDD